MTTLSHDEERLLRDALWRVYRAGQIPYPDSSAPLVPAVVAAIEALTPEPYADLSSVPEPCLGFFSIGGTE